MAALTFAGHWMSGDHRLDIGTTDPPLFRKVKDLVGNSEAAAGL